MPVLIKNNETLAKAHNVYANFTADAQKMAMLEAKEKWEREQLNFQHESRMEGRKEGLDKGRKETARNLLAAGIDVETIARASGLTMDEVLKLKD